MNLLYLYIRYRKVLVLVNTHRCLQTILFKMFDATFGVKTDL